MEVGQRIMKSMRFSKQEVQPGQTLNNSERITLELADLFSAYRMAVDDGVIEAVRFVSVVSSHQASQIKDRFEKFLLYSLECGTVSEGQ